VIESPHVRRLAAALLLAAGFLFFLSRDSLTYTVWAEGSTVKIEALGHVYTGELPGGDAPLEVRLYPQDRHSTPQILVPDRGFLLTGFSILRRLGRRWSPEPTVYEQPAAARVRYVHFNPFRAGFTVHQQSREMRLEVNVPDAGMESWQGGQKLDAQKISPPWLGLALCPLLTAFFLAALLALLATWRGAAPLPAAAPAVATSTVERPAPRFLPIALFVVGALVSAFVFLRVLGAMPGFGDEMNYLMQGRIFSTFRLFVPEPPLPEFFRVGWMDMFGADGKVWGFHPPGNSLLLAIGWLCGAEWLTVPVVFGLILAVQFLLAREVFGGRVWPLVQVLVVGTSHYVLSLSSSYMAHAPSFLFISLFFLLFLRFDRTERGPLLLAASAAIGFAFVIRPMSAVLAAAIPLVLLLVRFRKEKAGWYAASFLLGLAVSSLVFFYTWGITGRFTLPYAIKGPEVGQTVLVRLSRGWETHRTNLFRNLNEFQHRVHSFGIFGNAFAVFLPFLLGARQKARRPLAIAGASFLFFVVAHSVLHWYGWKWEPRMLFDVAFLWFLLATAGLASLVGALPRGAATRFASAGLVAVFVWVVGVDLPHRLTGEYRNYNLAPTGVRNRIRAEKIQNAIVFFGAERPYSCYTPANAPTFDGDIVYAQTQGDLYDYKLMTRFPGREAWFTPDGKKLVAKPNFYRRDLATLREALGRMGGEGATVVMPWKDVAPTELNATLPARVQTPGVFLTSLAGAAPGRPGGSLAVFLESAGDLARLADLSFETEAPAAKGFEGPVTFRRIGAPKGGVAGRFPGFWMTCYEGTTWKGTPLGEQLVPGLDVGICPGENRSMVYETWFDLAEKRRFSFSLESDDGSGLFLDGKLVIDNDLAGTHGPAVKRATVELGPGLHAMTVKYFNGPGDGRLILKLENRKGEPVPVTVAAFLPEFFFFVKGLPAGAGK
jgi:hypothetical protein